MLRYDEKGGRLATRLRLQGSYDVWRRDELRAQLESVDLTDDVFLDLREVKLIDAGAAALFIALAHRLSERTPGARVTLLNTPRLVQRVFELCGASDLFAFASDR
jgi:anti-anti-sigma factor